MVTATSHKGDVLHAEAEIVFAHLNDPATGQPVRSRDVPAHDAAAGGVRRRPRRRRQPAAAAAALAGAPKTRDWPRKHELDGKDACMRRRVVVTGIGCVTPLGTDVETRLAAAARPASRASAIPRSSTPATSPPRSPPRSATGTSPTSARIPTTGSTRAGTRTSPSAPRRRPWPTRASISSKRRSHPLRRLHRQRRRASRISTASPR